MVSVNQTVKTFYLVKSTMCENSNISLAFNIYENEDDNEAILDLSSRALKVVPEFDHKLLCVIYLQNNQITKLPDDFFENVPCLMWLDLRDNELENIPKSIKNHQNLTHLLLQNNNLSSLPNELGTVLGLKVLQLSGNPLTYPPRDVISSGIEKTLLFLHKKFIDDLFLQSSSASEDGINLNSSSNILLVNDGDNYNTTTNNVLKIPKTLSVQLSEKDVVDAEDEVYAKNKGKCPKLALSRKKILPSFWQSSKYLKPVRICSKNEQDEKIKQSFLKDMALMKRKNLLASRDKILQDKKNMELLKNWRKSYGHRQRCMPRESGPCSRSAKDYPYDTSPEYMSLLTREDIEKDLPDKYKRQLWRRCKPSVPRKNKADVHLAMRIKQLFEKLEAIDLNRGEMTPRTEQRVLLGEIHKISEIKQKLTELSATNSRLVASE